MLADQLESQIQRVFKTRSFPRWVLLLFLLPIGVVCWRLGAFRAWLKMEGHGIDLAALILLGFLFLLVLGRGVGAGFWKNLFGPESSFLWSDELDRYEMREDRRKNFFWGVIVASLIAFGASWLVSF
jgi:hypothetical protein